jgi:hypothetical protein
LAQAIQALAGGSRRRTERQPKRWRNRRREKVPEIVPDIHVIHRLLTAFLASPTRGRGAWCLGDRDGGPGLSKSWKRHEDAAGDQRSDLRRQAVGRTFGFFSGPAGKRRRKSRSSSSATRLLAVSGSVVSEAGRESDRPKKGRGTLNGFGFEGLRFQTPGRNGRKTSEPSGRAVE